MPELARCRCLRFEGWSYCGALATQEDFLCDPCREGCNIAAGSDDAPHRHHRWITFDTRIVIDRGALSEPSALRLSSDQP